MNIRKKLPLEQQFELQVFESKIQNLSLNDARELLVALRENMLYQKITFRSLLKNSWGIGKDADMASELLSEG